MTGPAVLRELTPDGRLLLATRALRVFAYGLSTLTLVVHLPAAGLDVGEVGVVFAAAVAGGAAGTIVLTGIADRVGRRRMLVVGALLMALAGAVFASTTWIPALVAAALVGSISPNASEVGAFQSIEQAMLPETAASARRTEAFAWYNLVGTFAAAVGSLAAGLLSNALVAAGMAPLVAGQTLFWLYSGLALALIPLFAALSPRVEAPPLPRGARRSRLGIHRSRQTIARLSALFAIDSFAGGLTLQALVAYWFVLRFEIDLVSLGGVFFAANLLSAFSFLVAAGIANRVGLINTMVFTHLPSSLFLALVPFMPTFWLAVVMLLARQALSQMDVPTRQSYVVAVVDPDERSAAAGITSVARNLASAPAPAIAGALMAATWPGLPFVLCGGLKAVYDVALWVSFRDLPTPEERARQLARSV